MKMTKRARRFRAFDRVRAPILIIDLQGAITFCNRWCRSAARNDSRRRARLSDFASAQDVERLLAALASVSPPESCELHWQLGAKRPQRVRFLVAPYDRERRRLFVLAGASAGSLDYRTPEEDLLAQRFAALGFWRFFAQSDELELSDELHRILGTAPGSAPRFADFLAIVHPEDRDRVERTWNAARSAGTYIVEHRIVAAGQERWVRAQGQLEHDAAGNLLGGFGVVQDMTAHASVLRSLIEERERNRREAVLATVAHDLRNPLNTILLGAQCLSEASDTGRRREYMELIRRQTARMTNMLHDLLNAD
jgi:signal transduction histidine kinase